MYRQLGKYAFYTKRNERLTVFTENRNDENKNSVTK